VVEHAVTRYAPLYAIVDMPLSTTSATVIKSPTINGALVCVAYVIVTVEPLPLAPVIAMAASQSIAPKFDKSVVNL